MEPQRSLSCSQETGTCIEPRRMQSTPSHLISLRHILILYSHIQGLPSGFFPIRTLYAFLTAPTPATHRPHSTKIRITKFCPHELLQCRIHPQLDSPSEREFAHPKCSEQNRTRANEKKGENKMEVRQMFFSLLLEVVFLLFFFGSFVSYVKICYVSIACIFRFRQ